MTKKDLIELELGNALALSVQKRLRKMIIDEKKRVGLCIERGCSQDVTIGSDRCDMHDIERLIDSVDETMARDFVDDIKQMGD